MGNYDKGGIKRFMVNEILKPALISFILFATLSCNTTEPIEDKPGRRDYVWSVDTLPNYTYLNRMWGSSPLDVWAIGQPGDFSKSIWHYDVNQWTTDNVFRFFVPSSIYGFSANNVWLGGLNGKIWHYDGNLWREVATLTKDGNIQIVFDNLWGESPNDLYAFGAYPDDNHLFNNSVIALYKNNNWNIINTDGLVGIVAHLYKNKPDGKYIAFSKQIFHSGQWVTFSTPLFIVNVDNGAVHQLEDEAHGPSWNPQP